MQSISFNRQFNDMYHYDDIQSETEDSSIINKSGALALMRTTSISRDDTDINERSKMSIHVGEIDSPRKMRKVAATKLEVKLLQAFPSDKSEQLQGKVNLDVASLAGKTAYGTDADDDNASNYSFGVASSIFAPQAEKHDSLEIDQITAGLMDTEQELRLTQEEKDSFFAPLAPKPQLPAMKATSFEFIPQPTQMKMSSTEFVPSFVPESDHHCEHHHCEHDHSEPAYKQKQKTELCKFW